MVYLDELVREARLKLGGDKPLPYVKLPKKMAEVIKKRDSSFEEDGFMSTKFFQRAEKKILPIRAFTVTEQVRVYLALVFSEILGKTVEPNFEIRFDREANEHLLKGKKSGFCESGIEQISQEMPLAVSERRDSNDLVSDLSCLINVQNAVEFNLSKLLCTLILNERHGHLLRLIDDQLKESRLEREKILKSMEEIGLEEKPATTLAETILIGLNKEIGVDGGTFCRGQVCPFFKWESVSARSLVTGGPIACDGICNLPGEGNDIIFEQRIIDKKPAFKSTVTGKGIDEYKRVQKCLDILPPGTETEKNFKKGMYKGMHGWKEED